MKNRYIVILHVLFWTLLTIRYVLPNYTDNSFHLSHALPNSFALFVRYLFIEIGYTLISASCFYASYYLVATQLLAKKKYLNAALYAVLVMAGVTALRYVIEFYFFKPVLAFDNYNGATVTANYYIRNSVLFYLGSYFIYGLMYFFIESWVKNNRKQQEMQKENLTSELAFLRSQVNPHFLFNTINDIYALTCQRSDQAPEALLKLSELLRYMLREGMEEYMPLWREVNYLENIIDLQRISTKGQACIDFELEGYIGEQRIASLLFISFIENAIKHGVLTDPENPIRIRLQATESSVLFWISNKKNDYQKDKTGGIGLNNVSRRLQLIYPNKHEIKIDGDNTFYTVNLAIQLL